MDFLYRGGTKKVQNPQHHNSTIVIKFFAFVWSEGKEIHLFEAERKGLVTRETRQRRDFCGFLLPEEMASNFPERQGLNVSEGHKKMDFKLNTSSKIVKVFTSVGGFGVRKMYNSFFFHVDNNSSTENYVINYIPDSLIREQGVDRHLYFGFKAKGSVLTNEQVRELLSGNPDSFAFYRRSTELSRSELGRIYCSRMCPEHVRSQRVRKLRIRR